MSESVELAWAEIASDSDNRRRSPVFFFIFVHVKKDRGTHPENLTIFITHTPLLFFLLLCI